MVKLRSPVRFRLVAPGEYFMTKRLYRSVSDRKIAGVCGGLAEYFDVDSTVVRLLFIILLLLSFGTALLIYLIMWVIVPENPDVKVDKP